jgi:hypothetical protein
VKRRRERTDRPRGRTERKEQRKARKEQRREWFRAVARDRRLEATGVAVLLFGALVTALTWFGIRDMENVAAQMPVITSGSLVALGSFIVGGMLLAAGIISTRWTRFERGGRPVDAVPATDVTPAAAEVVLTDGPAGPPGAPEARRAPGAPGPEPEAPAEPRRPGARRRGFRRNVGADAGS